MHIDIGMKVDEKKSPEDLIKLLLTQRHIEDVQSFLHPPHPLTFSLTALGFTKEIKTLLTLLQKCKDTNGTVVVYTDYDADGITGGSIMWETLHILGFTVFPYVPHRQNEGYGFSIKGIDNVIKKYDPQLIISVDHGISAAEQIKYATDRGVSVIVTDHHTKPQVLPLTANALIHCPLVSGSGLSYITSLDIWRHFDAHNEKLEGLFVADFLALAALGTIADLVPLSGFSRSIAKYGLSAFSQAKKPGIRQLLAVSGLADTEISAYHAGFALAPRINAVGRLSHAIDAVRMFCTKDDDKAKNLAQEAQNHNATRQKMVDVAVEEAFISIEKSAVPKLIVQKNENWNEGIIGLISSKITERYRRPSIVMTKTSEGWKGSARSVKGFDITAFLRSLELLKHVGGHPQAGGFSLTNDQLMEFQHKIDLRMADLPEPQEKETHVDIEMQFSNVSEKLVDSLAELTPFGIGNPTPVFSSSVKILFTKTMGKKMQHMKFVGQDLLDRTKQCECIYFSPSEEQKKLLLPGSTVTIVYTIDAQYWQGKRQLKCFVKVITQVI